MWLKQSLDPRKTAAIVNMLEKMIETKVWKVARGLTCDNVKCRVCGEQEETVEHLLAGCKMLAGSEYTRRHNQALMILGSLSKPTGWPRGGGQQANFYSEGLKAK